MTTEKPADALVSAAATVADARVADLAVVAAAAKEAAAILKAEKEAERKYDFYKVVILALFVALPSIIGAATALVVAVRVETVSQRIDGMKTELVDEVRKSSHAEGVLEGKEAGPGTPDGPKK